MAAQPGLWEQLEECAETVTARAPGFAPQVGLILGSGLGAFADTFENKIVISYAELPHFARSSVPGHAGRLVLGKRGSVRVVAMQGRVHLYEGYSAAQVAFPARLLCKLGISALVVTNAAGGINPDFKVGDLMAITDHLNLSGVNALTGPNDDRLGPRFPDMSQPYDARRLALLEQCAQTEGVTLRRGVYAQLGGPSYETPAEIRMLRSLGADAVGMSTVPEVVVAAHMGVRVTGISCITNQASGLGAQPLSHDEVSRTADTVKDVFALLLGRFVEALPTGV